MNPMRHHRLIVTIALVVVTLAAAGVLYFQHEDFFGVGSPAIPTPGGQVVVPKADTEGSSAALTADWKTYRNEEYGFEVKYPPDWSFSSYPKGSAQNSSGLFQPIFSILKDGPKQALYELEVADQADLLIVATTSYSSVISQWSETNPNMPEKFSSFGFNGSLGIHSGGDQSILGQGGDEMIRAFQRLPNGNVIGIDWERANYVKANDFSYRKYLLPILSTFKFTPANAPARSGTGTLAGQVTVGPICPVERPGVPCPVPPEAYTSREVAVYASDGAMVVARQHFNPDGTYSFTLPAGTYIVGIPVNYGVGGSRDLPKTVTIEAGKMTILNFSIDTGIR